MTDQGTELTVLMPCLNEAETIAACIGKAQRFLAGANISGEVLIADNGSRDGSREIAEKLGAHVIRVADRGYGAALIGGIEAANGRYVIMGDADDSYDFSALMPFVERLRDGSDLVIGNRFKGGIAPGAMPFLHHHLGNPALSWIARLFFRTGVEDTQCGLRGFNRRRIQALNLRTTGMEFATEMLVRSALAGYRIDEVPTTLSKDGRSRAPHLRTWRDGWRHLCFLLMHSPKWLFFYPGFCLVALGLLVTIALLHGKVMIGSVGFDIHTFAIACMTALVGIQTLSFGTVAFRFATAQKLLPPSSRYSALLSALTLERLLLAGAAVFVGGCIGVVFCILQWASFGFGPLQYSQFLRVLILSLTGIAIGIQLALTAFLSAIVEIPVK